MVLLFWVSPLFVVVEISSGRQAHVFLCERVKKRWKAKRGEG